MKTRFRVALAFLFSASASLCAPAQTNKLLWYPPKGIEIPLPVRFELNNDTHKLAGEIEDLRGALKDKPELLALLPDVQIFHNAVRYVIDDGIFYKSNEFASARALLAAGHERAAELRDGEAPWLSATGNVVRGFVSRLDGSVQPYGLVVPAEFQRGDGVKRRLDIWFHGRGDTQSEVNFLMGRMSEKAKSEFMPTNAFVLHPYGRFMNAFHGPGEVDAFEALAHAKSQYAIDDARVAARGFSMGGAAAWHFGAHHAGEFFAVNPGAGFADVYRFMNMAAMSNQPPWYEQKLWLLYDATNYAANFLNTRLVAYSGEIDKQKLAADCMEAALAQEGMKMTHIIGPKTAHKYEPEARAEVARLVDAAAEKGTDPNPAKIRFVLFSLRYNKMKWLTVDALEKQWERSTVNAERRGDTVKVTTKGIAAFTLAIPAKGGVVIDGATLEGSDDTPIPFVKQNGKWVRGGPAAGLAKRHGLQGPIDDAFMDPFVFVLPTGTAMNETTDFWVKDESAYAIAQWRWQHRGAPRVKQDSEISDDDIASMNLVLFGDPKSNKLLARIADKLPINWNEKEIVVGKKTWPADRFVPAFIFPNPLNPKHYVVINSGFTYAVVGGGSNSGQTPKLPDWAVISMHIPRADRLQKGVADANFFDEQWRIP